MSKSESKSVTAEQARQIVRQARMGTSDDEVLLPPTIKPDLLADVTDNTVKKSVLLDPGGVLTIDVPPWTTLAPPGDTFFDTLYIYHLTQGGGREEIFSKEVNEDDRPDSPWPVVIDRARVISWGEGVQSFSVEVETYSSQRLVSDRNLDLIFDRVPPYGQAVPSPFPKIPDVTDGNIDAVNLTLPEYTDYAPGDVVLVYWLSEVPDDPGTVTPVLTVPVQNLPQTLLVPKAAIEAAGDGGIFALYLLVDKAGNISKLAEFTQVGVAIGPLPSGLQDPVVPLAEPPDLLIEMADLIAGVEVEIPTFENFKDTDEYRVIWGALDLGWRPIGDSPVFPLVRQLAPLQVWEQYGDTSSGNVKTPVSYEVRRGAVPAGSRSIEINVNLERIGPVYPIPDPEWPGPVNPNLDPVTVVGAVSDKDNELTPDDENLPATLTFVLDAAFKAGDKITFYWESVHIIEADHTVINDDLGEEVSATIPWA